MPIKEEDVKQLVAMGFPESQAQEALTVADGNLEVAVNYLLGGGVPPSVAPSTTTTTAAAAAAEPPAQMDHMESIGRSKQTMTLK